MAFFGLIAISVAVAYLTQQEYGWILFGSVLIIDYYIDKFTGKKDGKIADSE
jgi:hypothetical protein